MPQSVLAWVGNWALSAGIYISGTTAIVLSAAVYAGAVVAITAGLTELSEMLGPKPKKLPANTGEYGGTIESRRIIYGQQRVGGMNVIPPIASGYEGIYLHQVLAVAGHEVNAISSVFFDQTEITNAQIDAVTGTSNDGLVNGGDYADNAWIRRYLGTSTQTVDYILDNDLSTVWESNHRGRGIAYVALRYRYRPKGVYKYGKPNISFIVQGKKVYDPRLDSTNGGFGTHRYSDSSTWEYSANPALCLADYLMDANLGMGEAATRIDWTTVAAAANECDEVVTVPSGASPQTTTQTRYTCNLVLDVTDRYEDNIEALCTCMLGHCYYSSGKWQIHAGVWPAASAFDLTDDDLVGNVAVQTDSPRNEKYNAVRGQYYDSNREYMPVEFQPRTNSSYETADGERIWREIALRGCTNEYEAQRAAIIAVRRSRNTQVVTADFGMSAFKVKPYEVGTLTISEIGWTDVDVRCIAWEFRPEGSVRLTLRKESSANWSDPAFGDYTIAGTYATPTSSTYTPPTPTSITATALRDGVLLAWNCEDLAPGSYFEILRETDSALSSPVTVLATTYGNTYVDAGTGSTVYYYWVRAVSPQGVASGIYPSGAGASGSSIPASTPNAPSNLTTTGVTDGVLLTWNPGVQNPGSYFEIYRETDSTLSSPMTLLGSTTGNSFIDAGTSTTTYYYWIRAVSELGKYSSVVPAGAGIQGTADLIGPEDIDGNAITRRYSTSVTSASSSCGAATTKDEYECMLDFTPAIDCEVIIRCTFMGYFSGGVGGYTIRLYPFIVPLTETGSPATWGTVVNGPRKSMNNTSVQPYSAQGVFSVTGGQKYRAGLHVDMATTSNSISITWTDMDTTVEEFKR